MPALEIQQKGVCRYIFPTISPSQQYYFSDWSVGYSNYTSIPPDIPIIRPFPLPPFPPPLPASDIPYARQVPANVLAANQNKHILQALPSAEATPSRSTSASDPCTRFEPSHSLNTESCPNLSSPHIRETSETLRLSNTPRSNHPLSPRAQDKGKSRIVEVPPPSIGAFTPYTAPSHLTSHLKESIAQILPLAAPGNQIVKKDPYEEGNMLKNCLQDIPRFNSVPLQTTNRATSCVLPSPSRQKKPTIFLVHFFPLSREKMRLVSNLKVHIYHPRVFVNAFL
jgi:hypothetical protein